ncbi:MAG: amidohydrolase family protein [Candidatus Aminicenantes bacterium]|nr:amidohydrolase family protein [Candidatus Aminicenantes bacterium]
MIDIFQQIRYILDMIIDGHVHLFSQKIVRNVSRKRGMVKQLHLQTEGAQERTGIETLKKRMSAAGVHACLLLPTSAAEGVTEANDRSRKRAGEITGLWTAGTLHPRYADNAGEIRRLKDRGTRGIKLCSFSQGFALDAPETTALFDLLQQENRDNANPFFVVLDTFYDAHRFFGTNPQYTTTPRRLGRLVSQFPGIPFIAAHMAGLCAPFEEICVSLPPAKNLFLDTSNAAHTLSKAEFIHLLKTHGAEHIVFGTDWPWFDPVSEIPLITGFLDEAGFSQKEKGAVLGGNMARLMGTR